MTIRIAVAYTEKRARLCLDPHMITREGNDRPASIHKRNIKDTRIPCG